MTTQDHVWGRRVIERVVGKAPIVNRTILGHVETEPFALQRTVLHEHDIDTIRQTVGVCHSCNTGWMSDLEDDCGVTLHGLAGGGNMFGGMMSMGLTFDAHTQEQLALYAMKTAIGWDAVFRSRNGQKIPTEDVRLLTEFQRLRRRVSVNLFEYLGEERLTLSRVASDPATIGGIQRSVFIATLALKRLVFQVVGHSGPENRPLIYSRMPADFRTQIWPIERPWVTFPPKAGLDDAALDRVAVEGPLARLPLEDS